MATNSELDSIIEMLSSQPNILNENGRVSVITFHSTEDRTVKQTTKNLRPLGLRPLITKATLSTDIEIKDNPRSRSAQLRTYIFNPIQDIRK